MDGDVGLEILIILLLIIANGIFSMTELAIVNARKGLLEDSAEKGSKGAQRAIQLSEDPNQMFSTIQIGITLIGIVTGLYSGAALSEPMAKVIKEYIPTLASYADSVSPIIIVSLTTYLSLVIGELVPKRLALNAPEKIAIFMAVPMHYFAVVATPLVALLSVSTTSLLKVMGVKDKEEAPVTELEINKMLTQGVELGAFEKDEPRLVDNVFRLADLNAGDVMTPRTQLKWLDLNSPEEEIKERLCHSTHYRLPVGRDSLDELEGLVVVADVFAEHMKQNGHKTLKELVETCTKQPVMVPESISLMKLLEVFRTEGVHETVVLDEYGGFSGLVTLHDIMEKLVGLMPASEDELKEEENRVIQRSDTTWLVDGLLSIDEFKDYFNITKELPGEDEDLYKTVGGFLMYLFGRIPKELERYVWEDYTFEIVDMDNVRIDKIMVTHEPVIDEVTDENKDS
ncbi:hemolysin family protein [Veillonella criceti]|uniref:Mg2+ and Co2+ transporter CorB n=1 Tax=Veillonella criceti TaxID=103891 RepID=A0A380NLD5_9FIRM|nr:hemolysin family protein [Veillonella criceti]SUP43916.1 Putative Mg2+ and Co2+ transporter CorB [Veillonella criceti]